MMQSLTLTPGKVNYSHSSLRQDVLHCVNGKIEWTSDMVGK